MNIDATSASKKEQQLSRAASQVADKTGASATAQLEQATAVPAVAWDRAQTLESLGGDETLFQEVMEIFLRDVPGHLDSLSQAITQGNAKAVEESAHTLKGEVGYLGIATLSQQIRELEQLGQKCELESAEGRYATFKAELSAVMTTIHAVLNVKSDLHLVAGPPATRK